MIDNFIHLAPSTIVGNPNAIDAPASAIGFSQMASLLAGSLLTPSLPSHVNLKKLPPQTLLGNGTGKYAEIGFITFSQLNELLTNPDLPDTTYDTFDQTNMPPYTVLGNSGTEPANALPIPIATIIGGLFHQLPLFSPIYFQNIFSFVARTVV